MSADRARIVAPPPVVVLAGLVLGWWLQRHWPQPFPDELVLEWLGWGLVFLALGLLGWSAGLFRKAETAINPYKTTTKLVGSGPYRLTRNPMYLGFVLLMAGIGFAQPNPWQFIMIVPVGVFLRYGVIAREESYLEGKFGDDYRQYKQSVRRWL